MTNDQVARTITVERSKIKEVAKFIKQHGVQHLPFVKVQGQSGGWLYRITLLNDASATAMLLWLV